jgi:hypothetical protein
MKKWILLTWIVTWGSSVKNILPCPNTQGLTDSKGISYVTACIAEYPKPSKEFKTKQEADSFAEHTRYLVGSGEVEVKEKK